MPMARRISCLCHSNWGGRTASPARNRSQMVSQAASSRLNRRESGSRMLGRTTQLPSNPRKPSAVNRKTNEPHVTRPSLIVCAASFDPPVHKDFQSLT